MPAVQVMCQSCKISLCDFKDRLFLSLECMYYRHGLFGNLVICNITTIYNNNTYNIQALVLFHSSAVFSTYLPC